MVGEKVWQFDLSHIFKTRKKRLEVFCKQAERYGYWMTVFNTGALCNCGIRCAVSQGGTSKMEETESVSGSSAEVKSRLPILTLV